MSNLIFVYGTLRSDESRNIILKDSEYIGIFKTAPKYTMINLGSFPGMLMYGSTPITGEIYVVTNSVLKILDQIEGPPDFYKREQINIKNFDKIQAYCLDKDKYFSYPEIESGNWLDEFN